MIRASEKTMRFLRGEIRTTYLSLKADDKKSQVKLSRRIGRILNHMEPGDIMLINMEKLRAGARLYYDFERSS